MQSWLLFAALFVRGACGYAVGVPAAARPVCTSGFGKAACVCVCGAPAEYPTDWTAA